MKQRLKAIPVAVVRLALFLSCGALSVFLLLSGYESIYNTSLPFVHSVDTVDLKPLSGSYDLLAAATPSDKQFGTYGKPKSAKLPGRAARIDIVPALYNNNQWQARTNTLHTLLPAEARSGNIGILFLYCRANLQTISTSNLPAVGSNIFIDTDHQWRYLYKITQATSAPASQKHIIADNGTSGKLVIGCLDDTTASMATIEATLVSVQGIET